MRTLLTQQKEHLAQHIAKSQSNILNSTMNCMIIMLLLMRQEMMISKAL